MNLNHVATFVQVVEKGSFTLAASLLKLPTSSVSRTVARLERDLGITLLHRTTRKLALTDAGRDYYERARQAVSDLERAGDVATQSGAELRGTVRLAAPINMNGRPLLDPIGRFVREHPAIHIDVRFTSHALDLLRDGTDLAIVAGPLADSSFVARRLGTLRYALFAAPAYLRKRSRPKSLADLADHDCLLRGGERTWTLVGPHCDESVSVHGPLSADELTFVLDAAIDGLGVALLPTVFCTRAIAEKRLVEVLPDFAHQEPGLAVVHAAMRHLPQRVSLFRDQLVESLGRLTCVKHATRRAPLGLAAAQA